MPTEVSPTVRGNRGRVLLRVCLAAASLALALAGAEALFRRIDGFEIRALRLQHRFRPNDVDYALARKHAAEVPLAEGVEFSWFDHTPDPTPVRPTYPALEQRSWLHPGAGL